MCVTLGISRVVRGQVFITDSRVCMRVIDTDPVHLLHGTLAVHE